MSRRDDEHCRQRIYANQSSDPAQRLELVITDPRTVPLIYLAWGNNLTGEPCVFNIHRWEIISARESPFPSSPLLSFLVHVELLVRKSFHTEKDKATMGYHPSNARDDRWIKPHSSSPPSRPCGNLGCDEGELARLNFILFPFFPFFPFLLNLFYFISFLSFPPPCRKAKDRKQYPSKMGK